jgi:alpha-aminoadipic semialdehyde synthase
MSSTTPSTQQLPLKTKPNYKQVLLLGAGRVSKSLVHLLGRSNKDVQITVASAILDEARDVALAAPHHRQGHPVVLDALQDTERLSQLVQQADLVISLLPANMHGRVAELCVQHKVNLVTASYESSEMRRLHQRAKEAGIIILNEVGLDPGLDHMSALKIIHDIQARGGRVTTFSSCCGGLPAPEAANNPLQYKFSWNPRGVLRASQNDARYRKEGKLTEIDGCELLKSASPFVVDAWPHLPPLECLPNRDSLVYEQAYNITNASTVFRGTLRYHGFSSLMNVFQNVGLLNEAFVIKDHHKNWSDVLHMLMKTKEQETKNRTFGSFEEFIYACANGNRTQAVLAMDTFKWLGILDANATNTLPKNANELVVDAFCDVLQAKLCYQQDERDMVVMHHMIEAVFEDGRKEAFNSSLTVFGDSIASAMSKTVGYTAAVAAELILNGTLDTVGLVLPTHPSIYHPILRRMEDEGIKFVETAKAS